MSLTNVLETDKSMIDIKNKIILLNILMTVTNKFKTREKKYWFIKIVKFEKKKENEYSYQHGGS